MIGKITLPVKLVQNERWAELSVVAPTLSHEICGEKVIPKNEQRSFHGGHCLWVYSFKKCVHWRIPAGVDLDISQVAQAQPPRRQGGGR
jgi:hypothetical protein